VTERHRVAYRMRTAAEGPGGTEQWWTVEKCREKISGPRTAEERSKNDKCWDEVPKMTYWGVNEKIHSHYLFVVTPQQWVPTPIKLEESGCPERHK